MLDCHPGTSISDVKLGLDRLQVASQYKIWTTTESVGLKANILFYFFIFVYS